MSNISDNPLEWLYQEFARFYAAERCDWAPENPRRLFDLAFGWVYPKVRDRLSPEEFVGEMYETLRGNGDRQGLFESFDPGAYTRDLPLEDHFLNLFAAKLRGRVTQAVSRLTDNGRRGDPVKFLHRPGLGLERWDRTPAADRRAREWLPVALARLAPAERAVIDLLYWDDLSARGAGAAMGLDHKAVGRLHRAALGKLRRAFGVETFSGN